MCILLLIRKRYNVLKKPHYISGLHFDTIKYTKTSDKFW